MGNIFASVFVCLKVKDSQTDQSGDPLIQKKNKDNERLSAAQSAALAFGAICLYLGLGTTAFYFAENSDMGGNSEWSVLDSLYFCVVTISTVGYGDEYTPSSNLTRWMAVFYMFFGIALIGLALGVVGGFLMARQEELLMKAMSSATKKSRRRKFFEEGGFRIMSAALVLFIFLSLGVVVFYFILSNDPESASGDVWTDITSSVFLTVQTVTTVGYGSPTLPSDLARGFAIPYILMSTLLVAAALGTIADVVIERRQERLAKKILTAEFDLEAILAMDTDGDQQIDMAEFLEFMLVKMGKVSQVDVDRIKAQFHELDVDNSGVLDQDDIRIMKERARQQQQQYKGGDALGV